jgi:hypothetical protein
LIIPASPLKALMGFSAFYNVALGALGLRRVLEFPAETGADALGYGADFPLFWIDRFHAHFTRLHMAYLRTREVTTICRLAARAPNGGWAIDAEDYARMLGAIAHLGATSQVWLQAQQDDPAYLTHRPCGRFHEGQSYGFGFCQRHGAKGIVYYHDGLMHLHPPYYKKSGGSFFFVNEQGQATVVIFSGENGGDVYKALENGVINAMRAP